LKQYSLYAILARSFENARTLIGYAMVSTDDQNLSLRRDTLTKAGASELLPTKRAMNPSVGPEPEK
jgi:hypothetical protein